MHIVLLALAVAWVVVFAYYRPWLLAHIGGGAFPALEVLLCVLAFVGLPYVLLSANSTLIQAWISSAQDLGRGTCDLGDEGEKCTNEGVCECVNEELPKSQV